ncbi:MAG: acyltransferase [Candidatus Thermoplasmatota archaeon]|nr:acyltransferase [Candidatus Thermoplasmatota archaeon]
MDRKNVRIHPTAEVSDEAVIGEGTSIWHQAQIRERATIGQGCNIGKGVYIDFDVVIGDRVKIQNYVSIYHGVKIGNDVFLGPHCVFTNDLYPRSHISDFKVGETYVDDGASIGTNATIVCGTRIGKHAMIGAGSVVTRDVPDHALVYGNPAKIKGYVCVCGRKLKEREGDVFFCDNCEKEIKLD